MTNPYVRFYMDHDVELATLAAADFRTALRERDHEIERLRSEIRLHWMASTEDQVCQFCGVCALHAVTKANVALHE